MNQNKQFDINAKCPSCGKVLKLKTEIPNDPSILAPKVRSKLTPAGTMYVYKITSEDIRRFMIEKARQYEPEIKVEVAPRYCERKNRENSIHRSYAYLMVAFSNEVIEKNADLGWYGKIGENRDNVRVVKSLFDNLIHRYGFNRKEVDSWMKNYKVLEALEDSFGMNEAYINTLRQHCVPRSAPTADPNETWVLVAADAVKVIGDMLVDPTTGRVPGSFSIVDVVPISKEVVEYTVHLNPAEVKLKDDPTVIKLLLGDEKLKK